MICVTIAQTSHSFAFVDMLNAGPQCDLIEIRLDRFIKSPNVKELIEACPKPSIISCRRKSDGGDWEDTENARLTLLRQAILEKPEYIEIELDAAPQIRRYGPTKRIITYTNLSDVPDDIEDIYRQACEQDADVVKLTLPTRTPEEAWPLIKIIAKGSKPTVAVGVGRNGLMLNVLGRRYKAPWTYVALEKGMEAYPGMVSIGDFKEVFDYQAIDSRTPLLAVTGEPEFQRLVARVLNHGFRLANDKTRCLPVEMGTVKHFSRVVNAIKLAGVLVDDRHQEDILKVTSEQEEVVRQAGAADFVAIRKEQWQAFNTHVRAVLSCIEEGMQKHDPTIPPIAGRTFLVVGCSATGRSIASGLRQKNALVVVADPDNDRAKQLASALGIATPPPLRCTERCATA